MIKPSQKDYYRLDDYAPEGAHWIDVSIMGSAYQEEMDRSKQDHFRYRAFFQKGPWIRGKAPNGL